MGFFHYLVEESGLKGLNASEMSRYYLLILFLQLWIITFTSQFNESEHLIYVYRVKLFHRFWIRNKLLA